MIKLKAQELTNDLKKSLTFLDINSAVFEIRLFYEQFLPYYPCFAYKTPKSSFLLSEPKFQINSTHFNVSNIESNQTISFAIRCQDDSVSELSDPSE